MLCLSKNTDYALTALSHMVRQGDRVSSAREIAAAYGLPAPLLMKLLKRLHRGGILSSTRGSRGGYMVSANLDRLSLYDLLAALEGDGKSVVGRIMDCGCRELPARTKSIRSERRSATGPIKSLQNAVPRGVLRLEPAGTMPAPLQAFYYKLISFLKQIQLSDLVLPGRRIDVPREILAREFVAREIVAREFAREGGANEITADKASVGSRAFRRAAGKRLLSSDTVQIRTSLPLFKERQHAGTVK
jgi:Rrf2 family protein